ncbi:hypothetical protein CQW23_02334 [Capsicum baccatum]|uniref:Disease resistance protein winged helix domain-containing protein n=1 Tax=Capsicum baccatum TaxID=33114 RepID=A0A2G2XRI8_CAPBA|nr:hypothetical protein CQW23_02334 [Capsicum baccatum]
MRCYNPHNLKFLTPKESFELVVKRVFGKGTCPDELVGLGEKIAGSCGGVPLVVVVIAGALRGRPYKSDRQRVEKNVAEHLYKNSQESCLKFVHMSYDRLPQEVQTCFLYCGVFPRGFDIPSWELIRMWIVEGLIKPQQTYALEEIDELHLNDLAKRNLLILMQKRVLDFESLSFLFSKDFNQLFHLRYIAISEPTIDVKEEIWNMLELRHLHTNIPAKLPSLTTTTSKASCLQTLSMVSPESCKKDVLAKMCNLKKLSIRGQMVAFLKTKGGINNLEELKFMEHLKLLNDALYMNKSLHLPPEFFRLVRTVKKLTYANTMFPWSEADRLGQLESLEVLKLKENAFMGDTWRPELNAVPLELADIPNLHEMQLDNTSKAVKSAKDILNASFMVAKITAI